MKIEKVFELLNQALAFYGQDSISIKVISSLFTVLICVFLIRQLLKLCYHKEIRRFITDTKRASIYITNVLNKYTKPSLEYPKSFKIISETVGLIMNSLMAGLFLISGVAFVLMLSVGKPTSLWSIPALFLIPVFYMLMFRILFKFGNDNLDALQKL